MISLFTSLFLSFAIGIVMGVIEAWKPKVNFFIWFGVVIATIIVYLVDHPEETYLEIYSVWYELPLGVLIFIIGMYLGGITYKSTFKKEDPKCLEK